MDKLIRNVLILLCMCAGQMAFAQGGRPPAFRNNNNQPNKVRKPTVAKRFEAMKKAYINQRLALTPEQSAKFWPTYDEYQDELEYVAKLRKENNATTDPNGSDQFDRELGFQARITNLQKHYYGEFIKMMPPEKANLVFKSERDFKFELLRRLKEGGNPL
jgi:hypothetical protein